MKALKKLLKNKSPFFTLIIGGLLILSYRNSLAEFNPLHTRIVYPYGDYYTTIMEAMNTVAEGDVIIVYDENYGDTAGEVQLIDNNFNGEMSLNVPAPGTSGDIMFYGQNTAISGGVSVAPNVPTAGRAMKHRVYGESAFSGTSGFKSVNVNGMPASAVVTVTYKNEGPIRSGDTLMAVMVDAVGESFTVYRSSSNNTSDLFFYWIAEWDE
jgi:hypothetical protein